MMLKYLENLPSDQEIHEFRNSIVRWFGNNKRHYPWRETDDPFRLLIAEMMLRRTNADQVKNVYIDLFKNYPDSYSLSKSDVKKIEEILYPLGMRWRIPSMVSVAQQIQEKYGGKVPETRKELINLPGVGDYVAGAVLSIAFNKREWIVDSNIVRLFKRYFGIKTSKEGRRDKHVIEMAKVYSACENPRDANLAILDFAAMVCTPKNPHHENCVLNKNCFVIERVASQQNRKFTYVHAVPDRNDHEVRRDCPR